ncbi:group II intron reverse transcriptase/maturase [Ferdinandcohnia sp. SAFN-114]|uniref:group II intron reverse transcriptase/maturase n=1 Tax=Ferdinandcohnia sp. SAFN-114 TaxID=3387275 RepID=UPI003F7EE02B
MVQKLNKLNSEKELRELQDYLYSESVKKFELGQRPSFKGLLDVIKSEPVIITAIHKLKGNRGSNTPGSDGRTIRDAILELGYEEVIEEIQTSLDNYKPRKIRRKWIDKPGKKEKRPLGIPAIKDRVIQECVRLVIEPILEAQLYNHSYGFRPMRDAGMAISRIQNICTKTKYHWIVEGDISKFFDKVNHTILLKRLYGMGINDRRVLMIIKSMLKAGIMNETVVNELGTPQGGIISPLLANVYLDALDQHIAKKWENKKTRHDYSKREHRYRALKDTNLKPAYFVRYADDWVLITDSKTNAIKWKKEIGKFLKDELKLELSEEKTLITNVRKRPFRFLGFDLKMVTNDGGKKYITRSKPNSTSLERKIREIRVDTRKLRKTTSLENLIDDVNKLNSKIRGIINYYQTATYVHIVMRKYNDDLKYTAYKALKRRLSSRNKKEKAFGWIYANLVSNLTGIHEEYRTSKIPALKFEEKWIGITSIAFCRWTLTPLKNQEETPYTDKGRKAYEKRSMRKPLKIRADELLSVSNSALINMNLSTNPNTLYNFEYFMNRAYAFNRDKGKCRICGGALLFNVHTHHIEPLLPRDKVNRVQNLASMHISCHKDIHGNKEIDSFEGKVKQNILKFREKLEESRT